MVALTITIGSPLLTLVKYFPLHSDSSSLFCTCIDDNVAYVSVDWQMYNIKTSMIIEA